MNYLTAVVFVVCLASAAFANDVSPSVDGQKIKCAVCGMFVAPYADWNAKIEFRDSSRAVFDGSKDMFKYYLDMKRYDRTKDQGHVADITVKDYYSRKDIDAFKAFYVIWSDVYGPMGNEPIPFATEANAKKFLREHHGKQILGFQDITLQLLHSLDNPE